MAVHFLPYFFLEDVKLIYYLFCISRMCNKNQIQGTPLEFHVHESSMGFSVSGSGEKRSTAGPQPSILLSSGLSEIFD